MYIFRCASQLIFKVKVKGRMRLVCFDEGGLGTSTFCTTDKEMARAIRAHKFYREGRVDEQEVDDVPAPVRLAAGQTDSGKAMKDAGGNTPSPSARCFSTFGDLREWVCSQCPSEAARMKGDAGSVVQVAAQAGLPWRMTFGNYSLLKEFMRQAWPDRIGALRQKAQVLAVAKEVGLDYEMEELP